jgi:protein SDA1
VDVKGLQHRRDINKKTRSGDKKMIKAMKAAKKQRRDKANKEPPANFPALQLLHDPQTFAEKLFDHLNKHGQFPEVVTLG